jgi:hypothetical protein
MFNKPALLSLSASLLLLGCGSSGSFSGGGGTPPPAPATAYLTTIPIDGADLVWDSSAAKIYVASTSISVTDSSSIVTVDPVAGSVSSSQSLTTEPSGLAISDDDQYLYAVTNSSNTIQRFKLPAMTSDIQWPLGANNLVGSMQVEPGAAHTLAVNYGPYCSDFIGIFDDGVERPSIATSSFLLNGTELFWSSDGSKLYQTYALITDCPYFTVTSDITLNVIPVTSSGTGTAQVYNTAFNLEAAHVHYDSSTSTIYDDAGEMVNASNLTPVGHYRFTTPDGFDQPATYSIYDPALKTYFTAYSIYGPDGKTALSIQSYSQSDLRHLETLLIPDVPDEPVNMIRWGNSGLALVSTIFGSTLGQSGTLYLITGSFINPNGSPDSTSGTELTATPVLTSLSQWSAAVGSGGFQLTINGRDFTNQATAFWNGAPLQTTYVNSEEIQTQISSSNLSKSLSAAITVTNGNTMAPISNSLPFAVDDAPPSGTQISVYNLGGRDLAWDSSNSLLVVGLPGDEGDNGDNIATLDPSSGEIKYSGFIGSEPGRIALSENNQLLYVGLDAANSITTFNYPAFTTASNFTLGSDSFDGYYFAYDIKASPVSAATAAVIPSNFNVSPSTAGVVIYDNGVALSQKLSTGEYDYSSLAWYSAGDTLYSLSGDEPQSFYILDVNSSGVTLGTAYNEILNLYSQHLVRDPNTGDLYTDTGQVIQPSTGTVIGNYGTYGLVAIDPALNRVYILGQTSAQSGTQNYTIQSFNQTDFTPIDSITIENVVAEPTAFTRWGSNGLSFTTRESDPIFYSYQGPGMLYVIDGNFTTQAAPADKTHTRPAFEPFKQNHHLPVQANNRNHPVTTLHRHSDQ